MANTPSHVDDDLYESGYQEFQKRRYDQLRNYVQALQNSNRDLSDTIMNAQGHQLEEVEGVEPPAVGGYTISEWINEQADVSELEAADLAHLEDAYVSWEAGALDALKGK